MRYSPYKHRLKQVVEREPLERCIRHVQCIVMCVSNILCPEDPVGFQVGGKTEELKGNVREHTTGLFSDQEKAKGKGQAARKLLFYS